MGRDKIEDDMRKRHDPDLSEDAWNKRIGFEKMPDFLLCLSDVIHGAMKIFIMKNFQQKIPKISNSN